jgi:hypothetical protein
VAVPLERVYEVWYLINGSGGEEELDCYRSVRELSSGGVRVFVILPHLADDMAARWIVEADCIVSKTARLLRVQLSRSG